MKKTIGILFFLALLVLMFRCVKKDNSKSVDSKNDFRLTLDQMKDSSEVLFNLAFGSDVQKVQDTEALLKEFTFISDSLPIFYLNKIKTALKIMEMNMYNKENFHDEYTMLRYDSLTEILIVLIQELPDLIGNFENYKRAHLLYTDILKADEQDLYLRKAYNSFSSELNLFLKENKNVLNLKSEDMEIKFFYGDNPLL